MISAWSYNFDSGQAQPWFMIHLWRLDSRNVTYPSPSFMSGVAGSDPVWERLGWIFVHGQLHLELVYIMIGTSINVLSLTWCWKSQVSKSRESGTAWLSESIIWAVKEELQRNPSLFYLDDSFLKSSEHWCVCFIFIDQNQLPDLKIGRFR